MKQLAEIHEHDVDPSLEPRPDEAYTQTREAVRCVLFDTEGNIALNHRPKQNGYEEQFSIPGGGVDGGEEIELALQREILEETGCDSERIGELGYILEYGVYPHLVQKTYCYTAHVKGQKGVPKLTEGEIESNLSVVWLPLHEAKAAIQSMTNCFAKSRSLLLLSIVNQ